MNKLIALLILSACCCLGNNVTAQSDGRDTKHSPASKLSKNQNQSIWMDAYDGDTWHPRDIAKVAQGIFKKNQKYYNRQIKAHPTDARAYYGRGRVQMHLRKYKEAMDDFNMAIKLNTAFCQAYSNRGLAKFKLGDLDGAVKDCNQAIALHACDTSYRSLGVLHAWLRQFTLATAAFTKAIELNGAYVDAYVRRARVEGQMRNYWGAFNDFAKAIELDPNYAEAYIERANIKEDNNDDVSAIADCNKAIEIDPQNPQAFVNRGWEKYRLHKVDSAIVDFNRAIYLAPDYALAYSCRCAGKEARGNLNEALEDCTKAIKLDSTLYYGYQNRGNVERRMGDRNSARIDYKIAAELFPKDSLYNINRDSVFSGNYRPDTASNDSYLFGWEQPKNVKDLKSDAGLENLKGKVKLVREMPSPDTDDKNIMFNMNHLYLYNEYGYLTRREEYNDTISFFPVNDKITIKVNERGQQIEYTAYNYETGAGKHRFTYSYDAQGKLKQRTEYDLHYGKRQVIYYNDRGDEERGENITPDNSVPLRWVVNYSFNNKGQKTRMARVQTDETGTDSTVWSYNFEPDGIVTEEEIDYNIGGIRKSYTSKYDSLHRSVESLTYTEGDYGEMIYTAKYDSLGNKTEEGGGIAGVEPVSKITMVYEYDSKGNWIKQSFYNNWVLYRVIRRIIEYY